MIFFDILNQKNLLWSKWQDLNLRSPAPKAGGLNQTFLHSVV